MDISNNTVNRSIPNEATPLWERNTLIWGSFLFGVVIGFVAVYIVVAQPMFAQLRDLQEQTIALQGDLRGLVGVRDQAWEADNLLSDLTSLKAHLGDARGTLREIQQLRQDLLGESRHTAAANSALSDMARLQETLIEQQNLIAPAARAAEELGNLQARLVQDHAGTPQAEATLEDLHQVRHNLSELVKLKEDLASKSQDLPAARTAADGLLSLKDQLIERGSNTETARTQVNRMFLLQDELSAHAGDSGAAFESLDRLLEIKEKLVEQTPQVADAVQNLEILSDFRDELGTQIQSLVRLRESLMEIAIMETTIGRVAKALEPLAQIANVRRLGDEELRAAARAILDHRSTRLTSKPPTPRELPQTAEKDRVDLPAEEPLLTDEIPGLGADEPLEIPDPVPLPLTEEPATN